ncbi:MAG TPA: alanyl-tRNA editing protein [Chloroflexi bacterium]|nr:alanyl-tRNA editing protein [Chloroflexota bacterium]HHW88295.1 alanyl-tRNA editing protein [Chloroflexota bacterium]
MTARLDYLDAYQTHFVAQVRALRTWRNQPAVVLDQTCFYPTSGGQLHDTGKLGGVNVVDVVVEQGVVLHILAASPPFVVGDVVEGAIDWARRYDHMQQHSGQHLLSQLIYQRYGYETVSVHFGREEATLDLDAAAIDPARLEETEQAANELAYYALEIRAYFVDDRTAAELPLRRSPAVTGQIRIVEIDGFDYSACGGTHVRTTAEIAPIKVLRQERRRDQTRLTFLCGLRATQDYRAKHRLLMESAALFSTDPASVPALTQRLQAQVRDLQRENALLQEQVLAHEIDALLAAAPRVQGAALVEYLCERPADVLKQMATLLRARPQTIGLLVSTAGDKLTVIFCRSDDLTWHVGNLLHDALAAFGGRGGGRPEYAQGGGVTPAVAADLLAYARTQLRQSANAS